MCGIAGIITKTPRVFDYATFCTLGIANDARGGDSCGVFIDGKYEYGTGDTKLFSNYFLSSDLLDNTSKAMVAMVHCRKASVGKISKETAQPVVLTDKSGKVLYVLMHNGTIHNYRELAEKYIPKIDITGMTDSQVMARIFFNCGYKALEEYNGGAVFAIADYRGGSPKVLLFKGASKRNRYSKEEEEERPLYYCIDKVRRELVFSSIAINLIALRRSCDVYCMRTNTLVEFDGKALSTFETHSREKYIQNKDTPPAYVSRIPYFGNSSYDEDDITDFNLYPFDKYVGIDHLNNTYSYGGKKMHGKFYISDYGRIDNGPKYKGLHEIYFYNGIALKDAYCYRFLSAFKKTTGLSDKDFMDKFQVMIRFLSIDGLYCKDGVWYKATSPTGSVLYTGEYCPLTSSTKTNFVDGARKTTSYGGITRALGEILSKKNDINFKEIKEQCTSLMKQQGK